MGKQSAIEEWHSFSSLHPHRVTAIARHILSGCHWHCLSPSFSLSLDVGNNLQFYIKYKESGHVFALWETSYSDLRNNK